MTESDESYLHIPQQEKIFCQINENNELAIVDWEIVKTLADTFDCTPADKRDNVMLMAKLMWLVRKKTIEELGHA